MSCCMMLCQGLEAHNMNVNMEAHYDDDRHLRQYHRPTVPPSGHLLGSMQHKHPFPVIHCTMSTNTIS